MNDVLILSYDNVPCRVTAVDEPKKEVLKMTAIDKTAPKIYMITKTVCKNLYSTKRNALCDQTLC